MEILRLKNLRHNLLVNIVDGAFFGLGIGFASFFTILPLFVSTMTDSAVLIGLVPAIHNVGWQFPQVFMARWVASQKRYKPLTLFMTIHERLPFLGLALVAWALPSLGVRAALTLSFVMFIWQGLGAGLTANPWQSLIAKIIPSERRGTFIGVQAGASNLLASLSAVLAGIILERVATPLGYAGCFLLAFMAMIISWCALALTREQASAPPPEDALVNRAHFWAGLGDILRRDHNFRWFLVARTISFLATMGFAFYSVYAVKIHGVGELEVGGMTATLLAVGIVANVLTGWIGDRWSRKIILEGGMAAACLSALLAWWAPESGWFYLVFGLAAVANVSIWTVGMSIILEFGSEPELPSYIGLANTLVAPASILAPFLGGWLADWAGYTATYAASAVSAVAAIIIFHLLVREPRYARLKSSISEQPKLAD
jgi:MFS family permease